MGDGEIDLRPSLARQGFELVETHISRVFMRGGQVYKTKRPVNLGFLDFTTLEKRRAFCEAEVVLNSRLAPDVYLGVVGVVLDGAGTVHFEPRARRSGRRVVEWAVHMRRLRDEDRADVMLSRGLLTLDEIDRMAALLAAFHGRIGAGSDEVSHYGTPEMVGRNVEENFEQARPSIGAYLAPAEFQRVVDYQREFLSRQAPRLQARVAAGRIRDGHGDLRLEHVYRRDSGYVAIDCIEFNDRFRYADVCADLAFLSMDLRFHGRSDLAERLLATYARDSRDFELYGVSDFYESYRAFVRGKVTAFVAADQGIAQSQRDKARELARRYYALSLRYAERPARPQWLIVTSGIIASGKSTVADSIARARSLPVLSADYTRKELLGVSPEVPLPEQAFQGAYAPEMSARVYRCLRQRAETVLRSGRSAILDASFRAASERQQVVELAQRLGAKLLFVECRAPREVVVERLRRRAAGASVSDAREQILDAFEQGFQPLDELAPAQRLVLDTSLPLERNLQTCLARLV